jgi:signal transduction histidine kinase
MVGGIALDVTERLQLEDQLRHSQKLQTVGQLAAGIAHEFNNILTVIMGSAEEIPFCEGVDAKARGFARNITAAAERAAGLVEQLVTFGQKRVLHFRNLNCNEVLQDALPVIRSLLGESITLTFTPSGDLPSVQADGALMEHMLLSLAINARDAMLRSPERRLEIATATKVVDETAARANPDASPGPVVIVTMRDTGCGMDQQTLERLFEPFFTTKAVGEGSGLGLSTVYGIVRQHEGWIEVESTVGKGTAFHVFLPASNRLLPSQAG